ncbi:guanylate cyclase soluble subunit beta-1-like isoform X2 [Corticium candelabrum]|uniref:guanylate cyclase soluble subunit beta-1-like isoform X2 n=1 Tax=Corticium candelabrum TaxID=121492 RepID=UPI002E26CE16|nr:guanylate cyclase soluble subunit beta-1-like isoform X2 [Corticium candelabrum]
MFCPFQQRSTVTAKASPGVTRRKSNLLFHNYSENTTFHNLEAPPKGGTEPYTDIELQEHYGNSFMKQFSNSTSIDLLKNIAFNLYDFLNSLESVHFHLFVDELPMPWIPQGMRCEKRESDNSLLFHFCSLPNSHFTDPRNMVAGIIKQLASFVFKMTVSIDMISEVWEGKFDSPRHCVFSIRKITEKGQSSVSGLLPSKNGHKYYFPKKMLISPKTLLKACPFHIIFDHHLDLVEIGSSLQRVLKFPVNEDGSVTTELHFTRVFNLLRPRLDNVNFESFVEHQNSVVELQIKDSALAALTEDEIERKRRSKFKKNAKDDKKPSTFKRIFNIRGQMIHVLESESLLFMGMPPVRTLNQVEEYGLYVSDIPVHDATRDLILQSGALAGNITLERRLIRAMEDIEKTEVLLREKKKCSDKLLCSMLPGPVVDTLLENKMIRPKLFKSVTIMFSDLTNFAELTADWETCQIIDLLNEMYTSFDELLSSHNVYKVETVNDSYMVVGGCPEPHEHHAREVARMAIDMMNTMYDVQHPVTHQSLATQLRIGIHSGSIQAGVVGFERPRYCLFGDTVNVTSRALTNGISGKITITQYTYEKLKVYDEFYFQDPHEVVMKGVDAQVMCYILVMSKRRGSVDSTASRKSRKASATPEWFKYPVENYGDILKRKYLGGKARSVSEGSVGRASSNLLHKPANPLAAIKSPQKKSHERSSNSSYKHSPLASRSSTSAAGKKSGALNHRKSTESSVSRSNSVCAMPAGFIVTQPTSRETDHKRLKKHSSSSMITSMIAEECEERIVNNEATAAVAADCFTGDTDGTNVDDYVPHDDELLDGNSVPLLSIIQETDV